MLCKISNWQRLSTGSIVSLASFQGSLATFYTSTAVSGHRGLKVSSVYISDSQNYKRLRWSGGSVLAFGSQVRGFKPGRNRRIFRAKKSSVRLPSVPCRKITACKRTQKWRGSRRFRQNSRPFLAHSSTFRSWGSLASFQTLAVPCGESWNVLITGPPSWRFDVLLATALCKNLPAEKAQRWLSRPKPNKGL